MYLQSHFCHDCFGGGCRAWFCRMAGWMWTQLSWWLTPSSPCCRELCPAASESAAEQTPCWLSLWKGKRQSPRYTISTPLGTLLKPTGRFLSRSCLKLLRQICLQWDTDSVSVSWWLQLPKGPSASSPRLKSPQSGRSSSACQHPLVLPTSTLCLPSAWYRGPEMERE